MLKGFNQTPILTHPAGVWPESPYTSVLGVCKYVRHKNTNTNCWYMVYRLKPCWHTTLKQRRYDVVLTSRTCLVNALLYNCSMEIQMHFTKLISESNDGILCSHTGYKLFISGYTVTKACLPHFLYLDITIMY